MPRSVTYEFSERELKKLSVIQKVDEKRLIQKQAASQLNLSFASRYSICETTGFRIAEFPKLGMFTRRPS